MSVNAIAIQKDLVKAGDDLNDAICPPRNWLRDNICDVTFLTYSYNMRVENQLVEVNPRYKLERCTEDYVLCDLVHSMTLFPGEEVFLSTRTRHSIARFTDDSSISAAQVSRSSERIWMEAFKNTATTFDSEQDGGSRVETHSKYSQTNPGSDPPLAVLLVGSSSKTTSGTFDADSSSSFNERLHQHLENSVHQTNEVTRDATSISLTQINSHRETTSEQHEELQVSTRRFKNDNMCHTVTHYFYQIGKRQKVKITFMERTLRALNPTTDTTIKTRPVSVSVATNAKLNFTQGAANVNPAAGDPHNAFAGQKLTADQINLQSASNISYAQFTKEEQQRAEAVAKVEKMLKDQTIDFKYESESIIPTEATYVESELGNCIICEPAMLAKQEYELERMRLENELLEKEISLLEKHKDYRCCDDEEGNTN
jgi:hypothetical protein